MWDCVPCLSKRGGRSRHVQLRSSTEPAPAPYRRHERGPVEFRVSTRALQRQSRPRLYFQTDGAVGMPAAQKTGSRRVFSKEKPTSCAADYDCRVLALINFLQHIQARDSGGHAHFDNKTEDEGHGWVAKCGCGLEELEHMVARKYTRWSQAVLRLVVIGYPVTTRSMGVSGAAVPRLVAAAVTAHRRFDNICHRRCLPGISISSTGPPMAVRRLRPTSAAAATPA